MKATLLSDDTLNKIALLLVYLFALVVVTFLGLTSFQVAADPNAPISAQFVNILNSVLMFSMGVFFNSVMSKMFGIKSEDARADIKQAVGVQKELRVVTEDKLEPSAATDNQP